MSSVENSMEEWNAQFGDFEFFPEKQGGGSGGGRFNFEMDVAYPCRITQAKCVRSKYGDLQLEIDFDIQDGDSENDEVKVVGSSRTWLGLPKQPGDLKRDRETVIKTTQRRYEDLLRILSAAAPARFALYAEKKEGKDGNTFYDFDGEKMDGGDFNDRKQDIQSSCVDFADNLTEGSEAELLHGALLYIVKAENKRNPKYPYTNFYAKRPEKKKLFGAAASEAPF